ncbi:MAG: hypothetical protein ABI286_11615 [Edaphobacter sp.]
MKLLQKLALAATVSSATFSVASSIPRTIQPDNVILCEPDTPCITKIIDGRSYKVINTSRFTVMVAVSREGHYTRADVRIANHTDMPLNLTPDDFRVEVLTPKPKVLNYIPPASLNLPQTQNHDRIPHIATPTPAIAASLVSVTNVVNDPENEKTSQQNGEKTLINYDLSATSIAPNEVAQGRVFFQRDRHAHLINVVLPIAGLVFEFPYAMKK